MIVKKKTARSRSSTTNDESNVGLVPPIGITPALASQVGVISNTDMTLLLGVGELGDDASKKVLVPLVNWTLAGPDGVDDESAPSTRYTSTLTLENTAFLAYDLLHDLNEVLSQLEAVSSGAIKVEPARLKVVAEYLSLAKRAAERSQVTVDSLIRNSEL